MDENSYNIYCDESGVDNPQNQVMVIGSLFIKREEVARIKQRIKEIQELHKIHGELKWVKTSKLTLPFYSDLFKYIFTLPTDTLMFRCITVDKATINYKKYHNEDRELAFYKFYFQLLKHKLNLKNLYYIFVDFRPSKNKNSVRRLGEFLKIVSSDDKSNIKHIQAYPSNENIFIQVADILTGAVLYTKNNRTENENKNKLIQIIAKSIGKNNLNFCSPSSEERFNLFCIDLTRSKK